MDQEKRAPIGIIGAMDEELAMLKAAAGATECETLAGMEFCRGKLGGREVVIVKSGIGKVNAGVCAQLLITCFGVCRIINTGVGGALDPRLNIGDVVISTDVVQHDFDVSPIGFAKGEIPYTGLFAFPADDVMIIGGETVYRAFLPFCDGAWITMIDAAFEADSRIPDLDREPGWDMVSESEPAEHNGIRCTFREYRHTPET